MILPEMEKPRKTCSRSLHAGVYVGVYAAKHQFESQRDDENFPARASRILGEQAASVCSPDHPLRDERSTDY